MTAAVPVRSTKLGRNEFSDIEPDSKWMIRLSTLMPWHANYWLQSHAAAAAASNGEDATFAPARDIHANFLEVTDFKMAME